MFVKKINLKMVLLTFISISFLHSIAQAKQPVITKKITYSKTRDGQHEKAIRKWNGTDPADQVRYHYNKVDLNGDKKLDVIVYNSGNTACGTGGCDMLIFKGDGKSYELVTEMSVSRTPIIVLSTKTKGWNDLVMFAYGGGLKGYYSYLKFNGKSYPKNPTVEPEVSRRRQVRGD